jgi:YqjK-like protein
VIFGLRQLQRRRIGLVARCAEQRASIAAAARPIGEKAAAADRIVAAVRAHPIALTLAAGAVAGLLPRVVPSWLTRVLLVFSFLKRL